MDTVEQLGSGDGRDGKGFPFMTGISFGKVEFSALGVD